MKGEGHRKTDREKERGRGELVARGRRDIHYHKAGNFTRIMPELRIPRDIPRCRLSLSKFRHNGHTSTPRRRAFSPWRTSRECTRRFISLLLQKVQFAMASPAYINFSETSPLPLGHSQGKIVSKTQGNILLVVMYVTLA